jgi:hypothetical protein
LYSHGEPYALFAVTPNSFGFFPQCMLLCLIFRLIPKISSDDFPEHLQPTVFVTGTERVPSETCYLDVSVKGVTELFFFARVITTSSYLDCRWLSAQVRNTTWHIFKFHFTRTNSPPNNKPVLDSENRCISENNFNLCGKCCVVNL